MYAIISVCALVGAVGVIAMVIVVCVCVRRKRKQNRPTTTNAVVATTLEEPVAPLLSNSPYSANPPLTNPSYQPVPGGAYGSNAGAPPAYKP